MKRIVYFIVAPMRLLYQSSVLALSQVWANKVRALLTMIGIIIGVASVTAVIAALTGLKANILSEFETLGTNRMFIYPNRPDTGPKRNAPFWTIRLRPEQFDGLLERCPSVAAFTRMAYRNDTITYRDQRAEQTQIIGIEPAWHDIDKRAIIDGRPFSWIDNEQARPVCLIGPALRDRLRLGKNCVGE
ncbi:MAG TPA: ABC transporter permease, partial [Tepidisphaeraceae bacterium]|nr:ABC transporter permease [Tepidisphaeraceae bacterium]